MKTNDFVKGLIKTFLGMLAIAGIIAIVVLVDNEASRPQKVESLVSDFVKAEAHLLHVEKQMLDFKRGKPSHLQHEWSVSRDKMIVAIDNLNRFLRADERNLLPISFFERELELFKERQQYGLFFYPRKK